MERASVSPANRKLLPPEGTVHPGVSGSWRYLAFVFVGLNTCRFTDGRVLGNLMTNIALW